LKIEEINQNNLVESEIVDASQNNVNKQKGTGKDSDISYNINNDSMNKNSTDSPFIFDKKDIMNSKDLYGEKKKLSENSNLSGATKNNISSGFNASNNTSNSIDHSNSNLYLIKGSSSKDQSSNINQTINNEEEPGSYYFIMDQSYLEQNDDQPDYSLNRSNSLKKKKDLKPKKLDHFVITEESENTKTADDNRNSQNGSKLVTPKLMKEGINFDKINNKNDKFVDQKIAEVKERIDNLTNKSNKESEKNINKVKSACELDSERAKDDQSQPPLGFTEDDLAQMSPKSRNKTEKLMRAEERKLLREEKQRLADHERLTKKAEEESKLEAKKQSRTEMGKNTKTSTDKKEDAKRETSLDVKNNVTKENAIKSKDKPEDNSSN